MKPPKETASGSHGVHHMKILRVFLGFLRCCARFASRLRDFSDLHLARAFRN
eukprot:m.93237 g.93237  ORF g.93237 m.93237 type:complete len:52 (-) comp14690_c3_seq1:344-499(-)